MNSQRERDSSAESSVNANTEVGRDEGQIHSLSGLPKIVKFDALARCGDEIWIENAGEIYRLRRTRQGKLILTK